MAGPGKSATVAPEPGGGDGQQRRKEAFKETRRGPSFSLGTSSARELETLLREGEAKGRKLCCSRRRTGRARMSPLRAYVSRLVKSTAFSNFILGIIFLNSVLITLQMVESTNLAAAYYFDLFDKILMGIYILELTLKLYAHQERFLDSGWNIFDAFIVSISIVETALVTSLQNEASVSPTIFRLFRVFKALRAMRAIRAINFLKNLQVIIVTLLKSIPAMGSIILLLLLLLYIFAIIFVTLYKDVIPGRFDNLWIAMFSLFQLITLDDWSEYYYVVEKQDPSKLTQVTLIMSIFIVLETFICINLFIAVIVNNLERANLRERQKKKRRQELEAMQYADRLERMEMDRRRRRKRRRRKKKAAGEDTGGGRGSGDSASGEPTADGGEDGASKNLRKKKRRGSGGSGGGSGGGGSGGEGKDAGASESAALLGELSDDDGEGSGEEGPDVVEYKKTPSEVFLNDSSLPLWQRELQPQIFSLLASLDHNMHRLYSYQRTLDELVDVTVASVGGEELDEGAQSEGPKSKVGRAARQAQSS